MLSHLLYYQNEPPFKTVYSRYNLPDVKDGAFIPDLDEYVHNGNHCIDIYVKNDKITNFNSFGVNKLQKRFKKL